MQIKRAGTQPSGKGPSRLVHWHRADRSAVSGARSGTSSQLNLRAGRSDRLAYAPARSNSHRHSCCGWAQHWGGSIEEIRPGDVVWFSPGEKQWHGATPTTAMTYNAIQEKKEGKVVDWTEHVSNEEYKKG